VYKERMIYAMYVSQHFVLRHSKREKRKERSIPREEVHILKAWQLDTANSKPLLHQGYKGDEIDQEGAFLCTPGVVMTGSFAL
jgi:hypothetical protein